MAGFVQTAPVIGSYLVYGIFGGPFPGEMISRGSTAPTSCSSRRSSSGCSRRTSGSSSSRSTPSSRARAARTRTSSASRSCRSTQPRPVASSSSSSALSRSSRRSCRSTRSGATVPTTPPPVTAGAQPDWYMGFADGALRLLPAWLEFTFFGYTLSLTSPSAPWCCCRSSTRCSASTCSWRWVTGDQREHHLLDRPATTRSAPASGWPASRPTPCSCSPRQRHHGDQPEHVDQRHHLVLPDRPVRAAAVMFWVTKRSACRCSAATATPSCTAARPARSSASPTAGSSSATTRR